MLYITDDIRIRRADERNLLVECLEDVTKRKTGETVKEWVGKGYHGNLESAVGEVYTRMVNEAMSDDEASQRSTELLQTVRDAEAAIVRAVRSSAVAV